jgi:hypothetical protein
MFLFLCAVASAQDPADYHEPNFLENAFSPGTMAKFSLGTLYDQATVEVPTWGSGRNGLWKRAELRMGGLLVRTAAEYGVARLRETDPGYTRCRCKGFGPRSKHAILAEFVEKHADGSLAAPVARFTGIATAVAVTTPFMGAHADTAGAVNHVGILVGTDVGFNMLTEFWPEIKRTLLLRKK